MSEDNGLCVKMVCLCHEGHMCVSVTDGDNDWCVKMVCLCFCQSLGQWLVCQGSVCVFQ